MINKTNCEKEGDAILKRLNDFDLRIRELEIKNERTTQKISCLTNQINNHAHWQKKIAVIGITTMLSVIAWVIQYLIK